MRWRRCSRKRPFLYIVGMGAVVIILFLRNAQHSAQSPSPSRQDITRHAESLQDNSRLAASLGENVRQSMLYQDNVRHTGLSQDNMRHSASSLDNVRQSASSQDNVYPGGFSQHNVLHAGVSQDDVLHETSSRDDVPHAGSSQDNVRHVTSSQDNVRHVGSSQDNSRPSAASSRDNVRHVESPQASVHQEASPRDRPTIHNTGWSQKTVGHDTIPKHDLHRSETSPQEDLVHPAYREDVLGQRLEAVNVTKYFKCVDPEGKGPIQDLLCMKRPNFLSHFKNPCFVDWTTELQRLRCLPYFHLLGVDKSGTTDLHSRIAQHPHILLNGGGLGKETYYWCWTRYGQWMKKTIKPKPFANYLRLFEKSLVTIADNSDPKGFHPLVTGDGTPMDFWDFRAWSLIPQNQGLQEPAVLTPHLMRHVYKDPKFIVILRNPVDRLYSDYIFLGYGWTPESFRKDVPRALDMMDKCLMVNTTRQCVFSNDTYINLPMRLHIGMYSVFLREWLSVFARSSFYIFRTEDYTTNMTTHLANIFNFLDVATLPEQTMQEIVGADKKHETKAKKRVADMYPETRAILQKFYDRYNEELAVLLNDPRFLWMDNV
ncbi:hypothetical protein ACOMHN_008691 [Nucella lapillus]